MMRNRPLHVLGLAVLVVAFAVVPQAAQAGCVNVFMDPEVQEVIAGEQIDVALAFSDVAQAEWPIFSFEIEVRYCVGEDPLLTFDQQNSGLSSDLDAFGTWVASVFHDPSTGTIRIAAAGDMPLVGEVNVFDFAFDVAEDAVACQGCSIEIVSVAANEASQAVSFCYEPIAFHAVVGSAKRLGSVIYWNNGGPVEGAKITLEGTSGGELVRRVLITDDTGEYCFDCLPTDIAEVEISVSKRHDQANESGVSPTDASWVLQRTVGLETDIPDINPVDGICADDGIAFAEEVSGDGLGNSYDAALILRFIVDKIQTYPIGEEWVFCSGDGLNFVGHLRGDINGNYVANGGAESFLRAAPLALASTSMQLAVDEQVVRVALDGDAAVNAGALELVVPAGLRLEGAVDAGRNLIVAAHQDGDRASIAFAGAREVRGGDLLELRFSGQGDLGALTVASAQLDDFDVATQFAGAAGSAPLPTRFELYGNTPNPFNPKTTISFYLPQTARTSVQVYDQAGRLVRTLRQGEDMSGHVALTWDGTADSGTPVASGIYYYRVVADDITRSGRMVLVK